MVQDSFKTYQEGGACLPPSLRSRLSGEVIITIAGRAINAPIELENTELLSIINLVRYSTLI